MAVVVPPPPMFLWAPHTLMGANRNFWGWWKGSISGLWVDNLPIFTWYVYTTYYWINYASKIICFKKTLWKLTFWNLLSLVTSPVFNWTRFPFTVPVLLNLDCIRSSFFLAWGFVLKWSFSWLILRVHRVLIPLDLTANCLYSSKLGCLPLLASAVVCIT